MSTGRAAAGDADPAAVRQAGPPVVAAVEGSAASLGAVDWAARQAGALGRILRLVHVIDWPFTGEGADSADAAALSTEVLAEAAARARTAADVPAVVTESCRGPLGPTLVALAGRSQTMVLGHRYESGFAGMVLGSVSVAVASRAPVPVVIVPEDTGGGWRTRRGSVVVGIDHPGASQAALTYAFAYAALHGCAVEAVMAVPAVPPSPEVRDPGRPRLPDLVGRVSADFPDVPWSARRQDGSPVETLAAASADAALLVVGCHTRAHRDAPVLGSVSRGAIFLTRCPVAVV